MKNKTTKWKIALFVVSVIAGILLLTTIGYHDLAISNSEDWLEEYTEHSHLDLCISQCSMTSYLNEKDYPEYHSWILDELRECIWNCRYPNIPFEE